MNVVYLSAAGLNAHWLGPYGNEWVSTLALDRIACESVVFDHHYATDPTPAGATNNIAALAPLHEQLRAVGVVTALLDDRRTPTPDPRHFEQQTRPDYAAYESFAEARVAAMEDALAKLPASQRWFLTIETDRMLPPWDADEATYLDYAQNVGGFTEGSESAENPAATPWNDPPFGLFPKPTDADWHRLRHTFATTLVGFDAEIEMLWEMLQERGLLASTAFVFTSPYGLALGEHDWLGHATTLPYEEFTHVPLLMRLPKGKLGNRRVSDFTQPADIVPTLADLLGLPTVFTLRTLAEGTPSPHPHVISTIMTPDGLSYGVRVPNFAYYKPAVGDPLLFTKPDDRWEVSDISHSNPGHADELDALLPKKETP